MNIIDSSTFFNDKQIDPSIPPNIPIDNCRKALPVPYTEFIGLKNNGNTCFFNAALQLLNSMELFRNYFLKLNVKDCNLFTLALKTLFTLMKYNKNQPIDLKNIFITYNEEIKSLREILIYEFYHKHNDMSRGDQHDCSEYLNYLFEKLEYMFDKSQYKLNINNRLSRLYEFNIIKMGTCINSGGKNEILIRVGQPTSSYFKNLSLEMHGKKYDNLQELINNYFSIDNNTEDFPTEKCSFVFGKSERDTKVLINKIQNIPFLNDCNKYIIISLGRLNLIDKKNTERYKNTTIIKPNEFLHIRNRIYKLNSLSIHINAPKHYVSVIYDELNKPFILNDDSKDYESKYLEMINNNSVVFIYRYFADKEEIDIKYFNGIDITNPSSFINKNNLKDDIKISGNINSCEFPIDSENYLSDKKNESKKLVYKCNKKHNEKYLLISHYYTKYREYKRKYIKLKEQLSKDL